MEQLLWNIFLALFGLLMTIGGSLMVGETGRRVMGLGIAILLLSIAFDLTLIAHNLKAP